MFAFVWPALSIEFRGSACTFSVCIEESKAAYLTQEASAFDHWLGQWFAQKVGDRSLNPFSGQAWLCSWDQ